MKKSIAIYLLCLIEFIFVQNISAEQQRIIALSPHAVEILYAIGASDRIVGTLAQANYPPDALNIPRVGSYQGIQVEKVLALKPDLIIAWKGGNKTADLNILKSLNLPIYFSQPRSINDIFYDIKKIGQLTQLDKPAQKVINKLEQQYQQIKADHINKSEVNIFYQLWHSPLRTIGENSWINSLIRDCAGKNIFTDIKTPYPIISLESVLKKKPQMIIVPENAGLANNASGNWKKWPTIPAVKNQQIRSIDADLLHRQGPRAIEGLQRLCHLIDSARKSINP